jgi:hypothetical protein
MAAPCGAGRVLQWALTRGVSTYSMLGFQLTTSQKNTTHESLDRSVMAYEFVNESYKKD